MTATVDGPMTLREHLCVLRRRRWVLVAVVAVCGGCAAAYAFLAQPAYEARAELVMATEAGPRSAVLSAAAPVLSMLGEPASALGGGGLATQIQIIESRPTLEGAWGLIHERPEVLDRLMATGLTDALLEALPGIIEEVGEQPPPSRWPDEWGALLETLVVAPVEESEIIEVRCQCADPERARDFVNALVLAYLGRSLGDARESSRRSRVYIAEQLAEVEARLAEAEEGLRAFGERVGTVALDESARQQIGLLVRLREQAAVAESTQDARRALREELEAELAAIDERVIAATVVRRNPEITALQGELARAEAERVGLLEEYAAESMPVRRATAAVEELRARLERSAAEVVDSREEAINPVAQQVMVQLIVAEGEAMAAEESLRALRSAVGRVEGELSGLPEEQVALLKLQREIELLERFYLALKEKQQEYVITERTKAPAARLLARAITPEEPARPKRLVAIAGGLMAGLLLGLLAVGLAEQVDERPGDPERAAQVLWVPVLAALGGRWRDGEDTGAADEALRAVLRHLRARSRGLPGPEVFVIASPDDASQAGAVAQALARVAREDGERALVVKSEEEAAGRAEAGVVLVVPPAASGLLAAVRLLEEGRPVAFVAHLRRSSATNTRALVRLAEEHGSNAAGLIVVGARRSSARYFAAGMRT